MQLVLQHCCKTSWKGMLSVLPPTFKPSCNKSGCCKLREYWLLIGKNYAEVALYKWVSSFATKQVCLGPVNRATYTDFVAKSRTTLYFLQQLLARYLLAWENSDATTGFPREVTSDKRAHKFQTDDVSLPQIWVGLLIGRVAREICYNLSETLPRSG